MKKYCRETDEYYGRYFYDEDDNEFDMKSEIEDYLKSRNVEHSVELIDGYDSCGYSNDVLAVAWIEDNKIKTNHVLLECM